MKKSLILAGLLFASTAVFAQYTGAPATSNQVVQGGFTGPSISASTVAEAKALRDDMPIVLEGKIVQHLGKDKYLFRDATGDITVDIDHKDWRGVSVGPDDTVVIYGEVDKDWNSIEIDVDRVVKK
ncbi:MAG: YgiW/YdeI family stress tolerance OB fold protein [Campylobacteraceae bacterium]